jgi:hypothetical protein
MRPSAIFVAYRPRQVGTGTDQRADVSGRSKSSIVSRRRMSRTNLPSIRTSAALGREL